MSPIMHNGLAKIKKEQQALILHLFFFIKLCGPLCLRIINFFLNLARSAIKENHK